MTDQLPPKPYRCVNCKTLCEKPHQSCPDCGRAGTVVVRDNLDGSDDVSEPRADDDSYRCIDCGNIMRQPHKECPRCGGRGVAPRKQRAPPSQQFMDMIMRW